MAGPNEKLELEILVTNKQATLAIAQFNNSLSGSERGAMQWASRVSEGMGRSTKEIQSASFAAQMLSQQIGVSLPEGLRKAIAESRMLGSVMTAAFGASVWIAAGVAIATFADKLGLIPRQIKEIFQAQKDWNAELEKTKTEIGSISLELGKAAEAYSMIGESEARKLRIQMASKSEEESKKLAEIARLSRSLDARAEKAIVGASIQNNVPLQVARNLSAEILRDDKEYQSILREVEKTQLQINLINLERLSLQKQLQLTEGEAAMAANKRAAEEYAATLARVNRQVFEHNTAVQEYRNHLQEFNASLIENAALIDAQIARSTPLWQREPIEVADARRDYGIGEVEAAMKNARSIWAEQQKIALNSIDNIRQAAGTIFDSLLSGGQNVWQNLLRSFQNIFLVPVRQMFQNLAAGLFGGSGVLGKALGGIPVLGGLLGGGAGTAAAATGGLTGASATIAGAGGVAAGAGAAGAGGGMFASMGAFFTNPWTIGIGAGILAGIGLWKLFSESPEEKMKKKIKSTYGVLIRENSVLKQFVQIAKQGFGGNIDMAIRSAQVKEMVEMYAAQTGQTMRGASMKATAATMMQSGGGLYQEASYSNGSVMGTSLDSLAASGSGITVNVTLPSIAVTAPGLPDAVLKTISDNPRVITVAGMKSTKANFNRREMVNTQLAPGTITT